MKSERLGFFFLLSASTAMITITVVLLICGYFEVWHTPWYEQRFASTIAVAHGQSIYQMPSTGPLFSCIYGPLSYLAFLPAAFMPTVWTIFAAGSLLSTLFLLMPLALIGFVSARNRRLPWMDWLPLLVLCFTAVVCLRPLNYVACHVTADSPAICLMALSALILYFNRNRPRWTIAAWSSVALVFSVGCKQNMLMAALVIAAFVFFCFSRRFGMLYLFFSAAFSFLALAIVAFVYGSLSAVYFNDVFVPRHWPFVRSQLFSGAYHLYENSIVLVVVLTGVGLILFLSEKSVPWDRGSKPVLVFFAVSAALFPASLSTYAARGGDVNSFAHAIYFFLLGTVVLMFELMFLTKTKPQTTGSLRVWTVVAALALFGSGLPTRYNAEWASKVRHKPAAVQAYEFCKRNPGKVYFPSNSIGVYLAERKFYDTDWGVMILQIAGQQLSREEILKYIPEKAQYVALPREFESAGAVMPFVAPHRQIVNVPGLEEFSVFRIER